MMRTLFNNATFHTMQSPGHIVAAILVEDGRIIQLCETDPGMWDDALTVDLLGGHVYPGFIDTHTHSFEGGLYHSAVDLNKAESISEVLSRIEQYVLSNQAVDMIFAYRFDENGLKEQRFPSVKELDSVCSTKPLLMRRIDGHSCMGNSLAVKLYNDSHKGFELPCAVQRGAENDRLVHYMHASCPQELILKAYNNAAKLGARNGFTSLHTMIGDAMQSITHYALVRDNLSSFDIEFMLYPQSFNLKAALEAGATRIGGCILADGSFGSHTAALSQPYIDMPDCRGTLYQSDEFWQKFITEAHEAGLQVAVHCIGDRGIRQINDVYLALAKQGMHDRRHQLIHCELTPDALVQEIKAAGASAVMQPAFDLYWGGDNGFYAGVLGQSRARQMNRFKTLSENGIMVAAGSDWYITELDALQGMKAAFYHHNADETVSLYEAVQMYTGKAAWLSHDEGRLGVLKEGYQADMANLSHDIVHPEGINMAKVLSTFKAGKQVF